MQHADLLGELLLVTEGGKIMVQKKKINEIEKVNTDDARSRREHGAFMEKVKKTMESLRSENGVSVTSAKGKL